jgi:hypothetical protein
MTIVWQGQAGWANDGIEDHGQNIELGLKFNLKRKHGHKLEQDS